jgi:hypothetical protein
MASNSNACVSVVARITAPVNRMSEAAFIETIDVSAA